MSRRGGLGRGLGALIATGDETAELPPAELAPPTSDTAAPAEPVSDAAPEPAAPQRAAPAAASTSVPGAPVSAPSFGSARLVELDPTLVGRNPKQPREVFDEEEIDQLATSLLDVGMLQPLVVRPLDGSDDRFELVAGERRLRAALVAGLATVPAIVRATEDADLLKEALVENIHRVQLNPLEEAAAYQQLLEDFGVTQEELASKLGRSRPTISNTIRLLSLPPDVQRRIAAGVISAGHAKALLSVDGAAAQSRLAERIVSEGLSVRATEEAARYLAASPGATDRGGSTGRSSTGRPKLTVPGLVDLQDDLSDALEARVRISMGARKGRIAIDFLSVDDLERIVGVIADGLGSEAPDSARRAGGPARPPARPRLELDDLSDLGDVDVEAIRRATDLSDLDDLD
jgi:ParB family transcriptional regulator, chromosome partitioning protein